MSTPKEQIIQLDPKDHLTFFAIRNKEGKWFRRKGIDGWGETWTDNFDLARIYRKIASARGIISFFANKWPQYGIPDLVQFKSTEILIIDESIRVVKQKEKKDIKEAKYQEKQKQLALEKAERDLIVAKDKLNSLKSI